MTNLQYCQKKGYTRARRHETHWWHTQIADYQNDDTNLVNIFT